MVSAISLRTHWPWWRYRHWVTLLPDLFLELEKSMTTCSVPLMWPLMFPLVRPDGSFRWTSHFCLHESGDLACPLSYSPEQRTEFNRYIYELYILQVLFKLQCIWLKHQIYKQFGQQMIFIWMVQWLLGSGLGAPPLCQVLILQLSKMIVWFKYLCWIPNKTDRNTFIYTKIIQAMRRESDAWSYCRLCSFLRKFPRFPYWPGHRELNLTPFSKQSLDNRSNNRMWRQIAWWLFFGKCVIWSGNQIETMATNRRSEFGL